jgi:hypothetical protein
MLAAAVGTGRNTEQINVPPAACTCAWSSHEFDAQLLAAAVGTDLNTV